MTTAKLIARLQLLDPEGTAPVYAHLPEDDCDMVLIECSRVGLPWVLLIVNRACELCRVESSETDDSWDGLCPSCAYRVSNYMDKHHVDRDDAVSALEI